MNMQIVIDIPEEMYQEIKEIFKVISGSRRSERFDYILFDAVNAGTPLPKGHGRLIDASELAKSVCTWLKPTVLDETMLVDIAEVGVGVIDEIEEQPTVIEADKES